MRVITPAGHHVVAIRELRAGTVKARRPRASAVEAKRRALHGDEHRSSIDRVMAGTSQVVTCVVTSRGREWTWNATLARTRSGCDVRRATWRQRVAFGDQHFQEVRDRIVRTIWATISAHIVTRNAALSGRRHRPLDTDAGTAAMA